MELKKTCAVCCEAKWLPCFAHGHDDCQSCEAIKARPKDDYGRAFVGVVTGAHKRPRYEANLATEKRCARCKEVKSTAFFYRSERGFGSYCKQCQSEYARERNQKWKREHPPEPPKPYEPPLRLSIANLIPGAPTLVGADRTDIPFNMVLGDRRWIEPLPTLDEYELEVYA